MHLEHCCFPDAIKASYRVLLVFNGMDLDPMEISMYGIEFSQQTTISKSLPSCCSLNCPPTPIYLQLHLVGNQRSGGRDQWNLFLLLFLLRWILQGIPKIHLPLLVHKCCLHFQTHPNNVKALDITIQHEGLSEKREKSEINPYCVSDGSWWRSTSGTEEKSTVTSRLDDCNSLNMDLPLRLISAFLPISSET